jgi:hypothetical protein
MVGWSRNRTFQFSILSFGRNVAIGRHSLKLFLSHKRRCYPHLPSLSSFAISCPLRPQSRDSRCSVSWRPSRILHRIFFCCRLLAPVRASCVFPEPPIPIKTTTLGDSPSKRPIAISRVCRRPCRITQLCVPINGSSQNVDLQRAV